MFLRGIMLKSHVKCKALFYSNLMFKNKYVMITWLVIAEGHVDLNI